jgi:hypothetical protein
MNKNEFRKQPDRFQPSRSSLEAVAHLEDGLGETVAYLKGV